MQFKVQYAYVVMHIEYINRAIAPGLAQVERALRSIVDDEFEERDRGHEVAQAYYEHMCARVFCFVPLTFS